MNLPEVPLLPGSRRSRTASLSLTALGIIVGLQLAALVVAGVQRYAPGLVEAPESTETAPLPVSDPAAAERAILEAAAAAARVSSPPTAALPSPQRPALPDVAPSGVKPSPVVPQRPATESRIAALVSQARQLRERGDMQGALVKLREAETIDLENPLVLTELAGTYEAMNMMDQAMTLWRKVAEMGEAGGTLADLAAMKLTAATVRSTPAAPTGAPGVMTDEEGLMPGSTLGLIDIKTIEEEDPEAEKKLKLRIGIKARSTVQVDVQDVIIQVFFYDVLDREHVVQTNASVSSRWVTPPADWSEDGIEILEVGYLQPRAETEPVEDFPSETREYLGYIVRVYYQDELQDVRSDPVRLLSLFPAPLQVEN